MLLLTVSTVAILSNLLCFLNYEHTTKTPIYISGGEPREVQHYKVENVYPSRQSSCLTEI